VRKDYFEEGINMVMKMPKVLNCDAKECAYNMDNQCHAMAITVGDMEECPLCDTAVKSEKKAGISDMDAGVGACKVDVCQFNESLECTAKGINVKLHSVHAECATFKSK